MTHLHIEGNLLNLDLISELPTPDSITSLWTTAQHYWSAFQQRTDKGTTETRNLWVIPLLTTLGYAPRYRPAADRIQNRTFPISHYCDSDNSPPLHIIASETPLEARTQNRQSAHTLLQDYLNHTEHLWGITTNGNQWRLLRNSSLMTRLSYIEVDLAGILNSDNYADFCLFVKLFQRDNLPRNLDYNCPLEQVYQRTIEEGSRVRDRLRDGVKDAIEILGTGFLEHSHNQHLAQITPYNFYRQLLLLIYRLLFLMTAEARGLLCDGTNPDRYAIYQTHYSIERLRRLADHLRDSSGKTFQDLYEGLKVTFQLFDERGLGKQLSLSPLNGDLFNSQSLADLQQCKLSNHHLISAIRKLSLYAKSENAPLCRVNYAGLDVEELGSVYESLLDYAPYIDHQNHRFELIAGTERKSTGAYYTPSELVAQLIKSALEPVIEQKLAEAKQYLATLPKNQNSLTPQPPLPEGEGDQDCWEIPDSLRQKMQEVAQQFRKQPTPSEAILWEAIRNRKLGNRKFRRQHPIGTFIVDFFCHEENLIVEIDGPIHETQQQLDQQRQQLLESLGLRFVRISSHLVETNLPKALEIIQQSFLHPSPYGRGAGGEGHIPPSPSGRGAGGEGHSPHGRRAGGEGHIPPSLSGRETEGEGQFPPSPYGRETEGEGHIPPSPYGRGAGGEGHSPQEAALLSIKVCDPACGSGHFLLAAARRIGKELAIIRTGEPTPSPTALRLAIRDVIQHCIYGVDINPLAVDLCKVALWIEGFCAGMPLNFLDHRIKCGNSLVGVMDLSVLKEGIPDTAYQAVTGDISELATQIKKTNKKERQNPNQLSMLNDIEFTEHQTNYAQTLQNLENIAETTPDNYRQKQAEYEKLRRNPQWWQDHTACNLWTSAFFHKLTPENFQLIPTTSALNQFLRGNKQISKIVAEANRLAEQLKFFHWHLEFPEVFSSTPPLPVGEGQGVRDTFPPPSQGERQGVRDTFPPRSQEEGAGVRDTFPPRSVEEGSGVRDSSPPLGQTVRSGFDCILGNPPWERIKLQEKEFFATKLPEIASARNKAEREKLIEALTTQNLELAKEFENAKHTAQAQSKFLRESGRFPLTAVGDINTYSVFAETARSLLNSQGRAGIIVPTGIATDDTCKRFFSDLTQTQNLVSLYDFENRKKLFADVDSRMKFSLLGMTKSQIPSASFAFFLTQPRQIEQPNRVFQLSPSDIALINPNTLTCPIFRTRQDAEIIKKIYQNVPVLENESTGENPWGISFMRMFDMANDSKLFHNSPSSNTVPLYEAKMFHQFNHRWATYDYSPLPQGEEQAERKTRDVRLEELTDPNFTITPRYWVDKSEVENRLANRWNRKWLIAFRDVTNSTNERTAIFSILPRVAVGHKAPLFFSAQTNWKLYSLLLANFNSLVFDYIARQKIGGTSLSFFILRQLPVLPPSAYSEADIQFIVPRVLELTYTAWDIKPFADDVWNSLTPHPPLPWGEGEQEDFLHSSPSGGAQGGGVSILTQASRQSQLSIPLDITTHQQLELTVPPEDHTNQNRLRQLILEQWQANRALTPHPPLPEGEGEQEGTPLPPFIWNEDRRAIIRAELDAYYAKLYGLTRDELRYILDPADIYGADFPSETFRVLKNNEISKYGEYRTQRLVLEAWDKLGFRQ